MASAKIHLIGLKADAFRHPLDRLSTQSLQQLPGLDILVRSLLGSIGERFFYLENIASSIRVSDKQLPHLHKLLLEACQILDLELPHLYLRQHPMPNAYTMAVRGKQPFIVLHTSLIDLLNPDEIQAVIAHELGHLKCDHGVYLTLANVLTLAIAQLSTIGTILVQGLREHLMNWVQCAELTCDRAALLVTQNPKVVASVLMKLTGGSLQLADQLNLDAFLEQARAYDEISMTQLGEILKRSHAATLTHPLPVLRAREIDRWSNSPDYLNLLKLGYTPYNERPASAGEWRNW